MSPPWKSRTYPSPQHFQMERESKRRKGSQQDGTLIAQPDRAGRKATVLSASHRSRSWGSSSFYAVNCEEGQTSFNATCDWDFRVSPFLFSFKYFILSSE